MGRPPLNMFRIEVRLPRQVLDRIDALVGTYGRAAFVREAVAAELKRREGEPLKERD
jgi:Arc/MetJ-type ribon-helix-helix transcriptional regulator